MLVAISNKCASYLSIVSGREDDVEYIRYGLQIIFRGLIKFILLSAVAGILNMFYPTRITLLTFAIFRAMTGGYHHTTCVRSVLAGLVSFPILTYISVLLASKLDGSAMIILLNLSIIVGATIIYRFSPTKNKNILLSEKRAAQLKNYALRSLVVWGLILNVLIHYQIAFELVLPSMAGFLYRMITLLPISVKYVAKIDAKLDKVVQL